MTSEYRENLINYLVDTWEDVMEEKDLIQFYRDRIRYDLEDQDESILLKYAKIYEFDGDLDE